MDTITDHFTLLALRVRGKNVMGLEPDGAASKYERLLSAYNKESEALSRPVTIAFRQCPVGLETREPSDFPFEQLFHCISDVFNT